MSESTPETTKEGLEARHRNWATRYPDRWEAERTALDAAGWTYRTSEDHDGGMVLRLDYPLPPEWAMERRTARLTVTFPEEYPWFPPEVTDTFGDLKVTRHRSAATGSLCLIESRD